MWKVGYQFMPVQYQILSKVDTNYNIVLAKYCKICCPKDVPELLNLHLLRAESIFNFLKQKGKKDNPFMPKVTPSSAGS